VVRELETQGLTVELADAIRGWGDVPVDIGLLVAGAP
jgi:hypothetical protein